MDGEKNMAVMRYKRISLSVTDGKTVILSKNAIIAEIQKLNKRGHNRVGGSSH